MSKENNLKDYLIDLYEGIASKKPDASRNPQDFRNEIEAIETTPLPGEGGNGGDSALPIEVSTEAEMTALLESAEVGSIYKYTGESTTTYDNGALYIVKAVE